MSSNVRQPAGRVNYFFMRNFPNWLFGQIWMAKRPYASSTRGKLVSIATMLFHSKPCECLDEMCRSTTFASVDLGFTPQSAQQDFLSRKGLESGRRLCAESRQSHIQPALHIGPFAGEDRVAHRIAQRAVRAALVSAQHAVLVRAQALDGALGIEIAMVGMELHRYAAESLKGVLE